MQFKRHLLDNGLEIVAECQPAAHTLGLGFFVRTGARDEEADVAGVSHFLEHMVFKGTATRSADDVNRDFDEMGAHYNAFTSDENTVYYASILPECQSRCLELLADILRPSLRDDDFETEKKVIIEEIRMYDDQPPFGADERIKAAFFGRHPLSHSVLGTVESITQLTPQQMRGYFQRRYSPSNIVLAAAGRVDFEGLVDDTVRLCQAWPNVEAARQILPAQGQSGFTSVCRESAAQQYVLQLFAAPAAEDDSRFAAKLLATIVGDDSGSRFYWELIDSGLAEHASFGHHEYQGAGVFMTYMSCEPAQVEQNLQRLRTIYDDVERHGVSEKELALAKTKLKSRVVLGSERPRNRLFTVGGNWLVRREYRAVQDDLRSIDQVSCASIEQVLARYPLTHTNTLTIGPLAEVKATG